MSRATYLAALAASLLGGCASLCPCGPGPQTPQVSIVFKDGPSALKPALAVYPDPLVFRRDQTNVRITWRLPKHLGLKFPANGIVIDGEITGKSPANTERRDSAVQIFLDRTQTEIVDCAASTDGQEFSCLYKHTRSGLFKYTIRVLSGSTPLDPLDPMVMGD